MVLNLLKHGQRRHINSTAGLRWLRNYFHVSPRRLWLLQVKEVLEAGPDEADLVGLSEFAKLEAQLSN